MQKKPIASEKMLSVPHLVIIFLVALIVFGPEKLPELARGFGRAMAEFKRATGDLRAGFEEHMRELERESRINEAKKRQAEQDQANTILPPLPAAEPAATSSSEPPSADAPSATQTDAPAFAETASEKPSDGHS